jgi:hypothetical protein
MWLKFCALAQMAVKPIQPSVNDAKTVPETRPCHRGYSRIGFKVPNKLKLIEFISGCDVTHGLLSKS